MPDVPETPRYKVVPTGYVKGRLKELARQAQAAGQLPQLQKDLQEIYSHLESRPLSWAELRLATGGTDFTECFRHFKNLVLRYLVFEHKQAVNVLEIEVVTLDQEHS